jgi:hypothetical protein
MEDPEKFAPEWTGVFTPGMIYLRCADVIET